MIKYAMEGKKFGRWLVLKRAPTKSDKRSVWYCKCDCGNEKICDGYYLRAGKTKSCGCYTGELIKIAKRLKPGESGRNQLYLRYKFSAKDRNLNWDLDMEVFVNLTKSTCHYCGEVPIRVYKNSGCRGKEAIEYSSYSYNGIDRKDNSSGYYKENTVSCCKHCNFMKSNMPYKKFIEIVRKIAENTKDEI